MWEVPRYRIKAYLRSLRRSRSNVDRSQKPLLHLKRTRGQIVVTEGVAYQSDVIPASVILNDLSASGVFLFSSKPLLTGQQVKLTIEHPRLFFVKGTVVSNQMVLRPQAVLSANSFPYRAYIRFDLSTLDDLVEVRKYCHEIRTKLLHSA